MLKRILAKPLEKTAVDELIDFELKNILNLFQPEKILLFGSAARGEMTDFSDLDLLVIVDDQTDLKQLKKDFYCRKKTHSVPVDIIFMTSSDYLTKSQIGGIAMICQQEGRLLFEKKAL